MGQRTTLCGVAPTPLPPLEEGVALARRPTICDAPLYAVPLPPYSLDVRFGGSGTAYSKAAHIPVRRAGATPLSLKVHPLCLQYAELVSPEMSLNAVWGPAGIAMLCWQHSARDQTLPPFDGS